MLSWKQIAAIVNTMEHNIREVKAELVLWLSLCLQAPFSKASVSEQHPAFIKQSNKRSWEELCRDRLQAFTTPSGVTNVPASCFIVRKALLSISLSLWLLDAIHSPKIACQKALFNGLQYIILHRSAFGISSSHMQHQVMEIVLFFGRLISLRICM